MSTYEPDRFDHLGPVVGPMPPASEYAGTAWTAPAPASAWEAAGRFPGGWQWTPSWEHLEESEREWLRSSRRAARRRTQLLAGLSLGIVTGLVFGLRRWRRV